jgi:hypothetical protein
MAINVSFNGATIYKPGAYSEVQIDLGGGFPLSPTGIIAIFGEADAGAPGAQVVDISQNFFTPDQYPQILSQYRSGNIVDACNFLFAPGADGALPSGAQTVYIYKTNASTQASIALPSSYGTVTAKEWGVGGNRITLKVTLSGSGSAQQATITLNQKRDTLVVTGVVGGNVLLTATNTATGSTVTNNGTSLMLFNGTTTTSLLLSNYNSVADLASDIALLPGWTVTTSAAAMVTQVSVLDQVTSLSATTGAAITSNANDVKQFFANSNLATLSNAATSGLPAAMAETALSGGSLGGTSSAAIVDALAQFQKIYVNAVVPLMSRDATADISDSLTDPSSTYTIAGIHQAVKTHISLMRTTKEKSERQGYLSIKETYANSITTAQGLAYAPIQLCIQDINQLDASGNLQWFQPWAGSCFLAGARGGAPVGLPMTYKYFNMSGIRQTSQPMSTPEQNIVIDFDPALDYDQAIQSGITFWEAPQTGGYRLVVDNTTYGADDNWVYNRANVLYASDILAYDFRNQLQNIYVGVKNTVTAAEIKTTCDSILTSYLAQGITVSTSDAQNGYKQLIVQLVGNTVNISVTVKLVEGIDFVLADITLQRASSSA